MRLVGASQWGSGVARFIFIHSIQTPAFNPHPYLSTHVLTAHCSEATWHAVLAMAAQIREKNLRISFFNSTPQVNKRQGGSLIKFSCST